MTKPKAATESRQSPGRFRSAWLVLMGQRITPQQMLGEWAVIQTQAADIFNKFSSLAARLVKAEKNALAAAMQEIDDVSEQAHIGENPMALPGGDRKAALRRRAYSRRTGGKMRRRSYVDGDQDQQE